MYYFYQLKRSLDARIQGFKVIQFLFEVLNHAVVQF